MDELNPEVAETLVINGYTIEIVQDDEADDPRTNQMNLSTMALYHKRMNLGDWNRPEMIDMLERCQSWEEVKAELVKLYNPVVILPVYCYQHGGITISTQVEPGWYHYRWDGGQLGFVFATRRSVLNIFGWSRITAERLAEVEKYVKMEVETYDNYLNNEVYGYVITHPGGDTDSCFGFYGQAQAIQAAKEAVEYYSKEI